jgi:hypothetical protein
MLGFVMVWCLAACAKSTGILPAGPDTYTVTEHYAPIRGGSMTAEQQAMAEATTFCTQQGRQFYPVNMMTPANRNPWGTTDYSVTFQCLLSDNSPSQTAGPARGPQEDPGGTSARATEVTLWRRGGVLQVPVTINGAIQLAFTVDSGADDVSIPADVVMTLIRTGTIKEADFLGKQTYSLANGSTMPSARFRIRSLKVGDRVLENVTGGIAPVSGPLLLGQSFLRRLKSWSIDNNRGVLVLE